MKIKHLLILLLFITGPVALMQAQQYKILRSAEKDFLGIYPLTDMEKEDVYGFLSVSKSVKPANKMEKLYYTVLDRNLNPMIKGVIDEPVRHKKSQLKVTDISYSNEKIFLILEEYIVQVTRYGTYNEHILTHFIMLDIPSNKILFRQIAENNFTIQGNKIVKIKGKGRGKIDRVVSWPARDGFLVYANYFEPSGVKMVYGYVFYDMKGKKQWEKWIEYAKIFKKTSNAEVLMGIHGDYFFAMYAPLNPQKNPVFELRARSLKTGDLLGKKQLSMKPGYKGEISFWKVDHGTIIISGRYRDAQRKKSDRWAGIYRNVHVWDGKEFKNTLFQFLPYTQMPVPGINEFGKVKGEGDLVMEEMDWLPGKEMLLVGQAEKGYSTYSVFVMITDPDFKVVRSKAYKLLGAGYSHYRFTHPLQNDEGRFVVIKNRDKHNAIYRIVKYYFDSKNLEEKVLKFDRHKKEIRMYPAKKGYVLISEYYPKARKGEKRYIFYLQKI